MENQFSQSECQWVKDKFLENHPEQQLSMYQPVKQPEMLIVETNWISTNDIKKLEVMIGTATIFAEDDNIKAYLMKRH